MTLRHRPSRFLLPLALGLACAAALAQPAPSTQPSRPSPDHHARQVFAALPARADAVIIVSNAAAQRATHAGAQFARLLDEAGSFTASRAAWDRFAHRIGCTSSQAFDDILGRHIVLVLRDLDHSPDWAILAEVAPATERRLRERLAAVPRGRLVGLNVLGLEDGAYRLLIARRAAGGAPFHRDPRNAASATLLLGPRDGALFDDLAPAVLPAAHDRLANAAGAAELLAVFRRGTAPHESITALAANRAGEGWNAHIVASPSSNSAPAPHAWSRLLFDQLKQDSLVSIMGISGSWGATPLSGHAAPAALQALLPLQPLDLSRSLHDASGARAGVFLQNPALSRQPHSSPLAAAHAQPRPSPDHHDAWSLLWMLEMPDAGRAAVDGDQIIAAMAAALRDNQGWLKLEVPAAEDDARILALADILPAHSPLAPLHSFFGPAASLRWGAAAIRGTPAGATWWFAALEPADIRTADAAHAALRAEQAARPRADTRAWLSLGALRPALLLRSAGAAADLLQPLQPLRHIESLEWETWVRDDGMIQGAIRLRMAP